MPARSSVKRTQIVVAISLFTLVAVLRVVLVDHGVKGTSRGLALVCADKHGWAEEVRKDVWSPVYGKKGEQLARRN